MNRRHFLGSLAAALALSPLRGKNNSATGELVFYVVGDWGTGGSLQRTVAQAMHQTLLAGPKPQFILSTGDNIYPNGVDSADDEQWRTKFEKPYAALRLPWWAILGNHDHRGNVKAQIAYAAKNPRWNMPAPYWKTEFMVGDVTIVQLVALDTTPLLQMKDGWKDQLTWLDSVLGGTNARWKVVAGHHPIRSYGHYGDSSVLLKHVKPILDKHKVALYCCGHDHDLQIIRNPTDTFRALVSGAGGGTRPSKGGPDTIAWHEAGGFAVVRISPTTMNVGIVDAHGKQVGSTSW